MPDENLKDNDSKLAFPFFLTHGIAGWDLVPVLLLAQPIPVLHPPFQNYFRIPGENATSDRFIGSVRVSKFT